MKKQLLSILTGLTVTSLVAQTPSPSWSINQNAAFTNTSTGIKFMDAVDQNVMWVTGYDGSAYNRNYNWFSRTTNGGTSFNSGVIFTSTLTPAIGDTNTFVLSNLSAIDANTAWVAAFRRGPAPYSPTNQGGGALYRTTNGGLNWVNMTAPGMYTNTSTSFANFVAFLTPSVGIANGDPTNGEFELWRTVDGGLSWSLVPAANIPNPVSGEFAVVDLYAKQGNNNLWYATNQGRMYRTTDAGLTWNVSNVCPATTTVVEIAFATPLKGVVFAYDNAQNFLMYNTTDGGVTWTQITNVSPNVGKNDIVGIPGTGYYASAGAGNGNTIISYSSDNGVTWTDWGSTGIQYLTLDFVDASTGWAGSFSSNVDPTVDGIWKYSGPPISGTVTPTSIFTIPSYICGPTGTVTPSNTSLGSGALSYSWTASPSVVFSSPTASAPSISFNGNNSYTITLTVTSALGSNVSSQVISVLACTPPVPSFTLAATVCNNIAVIAANTSVANPAATYSWSTSPSAGVTFPSSSTAYNPTIKFATPGNYTVTVVATNIGGSASATQTITVNDCIAVASNFTLGTTADGCAGIYSTETGTVQGVATATAYFTNHVSGNTYTWNINPNAGVVTSNYGTQGKILSFANPGTYTVTLMVGNASGISAPASKIISVNNCAAVGIQENSKVLENLNVYPNPAHDLLNITFPAGNQIYKVKLVNVIGAVVYEEKITKENASINLVGKAKGVYFLTVESNDQKATRKIIVE